MLRLAVVGGMLAREALGSRPAREGSVHGHRQSLARRARLFGGSL